jgi:hypothetical protein
VAVRASGLLVEIGVDLHPLEETIRETNLTRSIRPFPVGLPRPERGTHQETDTAAHEEPDDEIAAAVPACRDDGYEVHARSVLEEA